MIYKCVKSFKVHKLDDDYMPTERKTITIKVGSIWSKTNIIEAHYWNDDTIHLDCIDGGCGFIEISTASLEKHFEKVKIKEVKNVYRG